MKLDKILLENNKYLIQNYQRFPIEMIKGDGSYVWDSKGKKYLDFISGIAVNNLGHNNKKVNKAILSQLTKMLQDISTEAMKVGLELHPDKTKILHNQLHRRTCHQPEQTNVNGMNIEILPYSSSPKYLGRRFTFQDPTRNEIESRIAAGWRKFCMLKHELTTKAYAIKDRLRLFHGTVTPTVLYGCRAALGRSLQNSNTAYAAHNATCLE